MRLAVTGLDGQVVRAMIERAPRGVELIALGRSRLDLAVRESVLAALRAARCDVIVNTAGYTEVDRAESEPDAAMRVNGDGAGYVAEIAAELRAPLIHLSTDYVFDGSLDRPYREDDATRPIGAYGRSRLTGEQRIASVHPDHAILRTSWVYSPFGPNFVASMLSLGETHAQARVVVDQRGNPTYALDIADALFAIAGRMRGDPSPALRGVFHLVGGGEASWAEFAEAIFAEAAAHGRAPVKVEPIATADYPTAARRLTNSRLDSSKLAATFGVTLPNWRDSVRECVARAIAPATAVT